MSFTYTYNNTVLYRAKKGEHTWCLGYAGDQLGWWKVGCSLRPVSSMDELLNIKEWFKKEGWVVIKAS